MSAFIPPNGTSNPIFRSYLVENNESQLLTRAETLSFFVSFPTFCAAFLTRSFPFCVDWVEAEAQAGLSRHCQNVPLQALGVFQLSCSVVVPSVDCPFLSSLFTPTAMFHCSNVRTQQWYVDPQRTLCMHLNALLAFIGKQTWSGLTSHSQSLGH